MVCSLRVPSLSIWYQGQVYEGKLYIEFREIRLNLFEESELIVCCCRCYGCVFCVYLNHDKCLFATKQKRILINHCLNDVLQIWPQLLEMHHIGEMDWNQCGPPANCQIFAVHTI